MIEMHCVLQYRGIAAATPADVEAAAQEELKSLGATWHSEFLPEHFQEQAYSLYGAVYKRRGKRYENRKAWKMGHRDPMVWSGTMERAVLGSARIDVSTAGVRVTMRGVRALNLLNRSSIMPDFKAEITATNAQELDWMARALDAGVTNRLYKVSRVDMRAF